MKDTRDRREEKRAYYLSNKDKILARCSRYKKQNKLQIVLQARERYQEHGPQKRKTPRKTKCLWRRPTKQMIALREHGRAKCAVCRSREKLTIDHIIPLSRGGAHALENIQILCASCNARKRNRTHNEWLAFEKALTEIRI